MNACVARYTFRSPDPESVRNASTNSAAVVGTESMLIGAPSTRNRSVTKSSGIHCAPAIVTEQNQTRRAREPVEGGGVTGLLFGLFVGTAVGLASWAFVELQPWYAVGCGIVVGIIGYFFGDRFWCWVAEKIQWFY